MLESKRLLLRAFKLEDAKEIQQLRSDFEAMKAFAGLPFPSNEESEKEWIMNMYPKGLKSNVYFAIIEKETNNFIGYCVARNIDYINRNADVGIIFNKKGRGKGYFREVSILFYDYLFSQLNLHKLYSIVIIDNKIALNSDKKIGFVEEGTIKEHIFQDGQYKDVVFISLYKNNFYKINGNKS